MVFGIWYSEFGISKIGKASKVEQARRPAKELVRYQRLSEEKLAKDKLYACTVIWLYC